MGSDASAVIRSWTDELVTSQGTCAITVGLIGSLWAAASGMGTAIKALNRVYDVKEDRSFLPRTLLQLGLTIMFTGLILAATLLFATGHLMAGGIGELLGWESALVATWNIGAPLLAFALVLLAVALLFWLAPAADTEFKWVSPGSLLFLGAWFLFTLGFAFYLSNFGSYNRVYGSLAAVIILLIWMYWTNMILLVAAELNAVLAHRFDESYRADPNTPA
jgi:membrane protein